MAAESQVFPPWLTAVPTTLFDGNGVPTATQTTVLFLPLTYYGPSIPLGPDWTYGGLTSPASTSTIPSTTTTEFSATTSTETPLTTTTATPTPSPKVLSSLTSVATSTTIMTSLPLSNSVTTLTSSSPTPTSVGAASHPHFNRGQLIGIIVGSILGFIFLFVAAIILCLCIKGRRRRSGPILPTTEKTRTRPGTHNTRHWSSHSHFTGWNERAPSTSGGEADPFLAYTTDELPQSPGANQPNVPPYVGIARVPVPSASQSSKGSNGTGNSSGTNHSGYGVLVDRPTLKLLPGTTAEFERQRSGRILSPEELAQINEENVISPPQSGSQLSSLTGLPSTLGPDEGWSSGNRNSPSSNPSRFLFRKHPSQNSLSAYPDADETATLLTARRVRVEELSPRSPPRLIGSFGEASSKNDRGLLGSLGLDRFSWFRNSDARSQHSSRSKYSTAPLGDEDPDIGQALLSPDMSELLAPTPTRPGLGLFGGERPISTGSARSGTTVYHDAHSSLGTPVSVSTPITPLPRALTPSSSGGPQPAKPANTSSVPPVPPLPDHPKTSDSRSSNIPNINHGLPVGSDILDTPAPPAVLPFLSSIKTPDSNPSIRDTVTDTTDDLKVHAFPPGLGVAPQKSWTDEGSSVTHPVNSPVDISITPASTFSTPDTSAGISIDVLEEAPPSARESWRSLASEQGIHGLGRRTTFGIPIPDVMSEHGSLYSNFSQLGAMHTRSTGSDPTASRRDLAGSLSSGSSRPSAFSASRTHSTGPSLSHSGSVSSDPRTRASNVLSSRSRSPQLNVPNPLLIPPPNVHYAPERAGTHRMSGSQDIDAERAGMSSPEPTSPVSHMSSAPWAGGLSDNWTPTP